jgi:hypothetical protein
MKFVYPAILATLLAIPPGVNAAENYNEDTQALVDQLREITEKSRQNRAADRWLQRSLEDLIAQYDWPWRQELLYEDFSDGDYSHAPQWEPVSGQFWIDPTLGLRSRVRMQQQREEQTSRQQESQSQDVSTAILSALLQEALRSEKQAEPEPETKPAREERYGTAEIRLPIQIPGTFAFRTELSAHNHPSEPGMMQFGFYEEADAAWGYLITLHTGDQPLIELSMLRGGRHMLIEEIAIADLNDGQPHEIEWRKNNYGETELRLDQQTLFRGRDRDFDRGFETLSVLNQGGDFGVRSIQLQGGER